jgi:hypothetical protein
MKSSDEEFQRLVDIIQTTPQPRINRQDAWFIAERLVEAGVINDEKLKPNLENWISSIKVFTNQDNLVMRTAEARAKGYIKTDLKDDLPQTGIEAAVDYIPPYPPNRQGVPWDIDNNRPYEDWELEVLGGVEGKWAKFRNTQNAQMQQYILKKGPSHLDHPEHEHEDCCK